MLQKLIWWFKGTTLYCNWKYEQYIPAKANVELMKDVLAKQEPNTFFRIGWKILFTNKSRKIAWIYCDQYEEANHG